MVTLSGKPKKPTGRASGLARDALPRVPTRGKRQIPDNTNVTKKGGVFLFVDLSGKPKKQTFRRVTRSRGVRIAKKTEESKNKANLCRFMIDFFCKKSIINKGALKYALLCFIKLR